MFLAFNVNILTKPLHSVYRANLDSARHKRFDWPLAGRPSWQPYQVTLRQTPSMRDRQHDLLYS